MTQHDEQFLNLFKGLLEETLDPSHGTAIATRDFHFDNLCRLILTFDHNQIRNEVGDALYKIANSDWALGDHWSAVDFNCRVIAAAATCLIVGKEEQRATEILGRFIQYIIDKLSVTRPDELRYELGIRKVTAELLIWLGRCPSKTKIFIPQVSSLLNLSQCGSRFKQCDNAVIQCLASTTLVKFGSLVREFIREVETEVIEALRQWDLVKAVDQDDYWEEEEEEDSIKNFYKDDILTALLTLLAEISHSSTPFCDELSRSEYDLKPRFSFSGKTSKLRSSMDMIESGISVEWAVKKNLTHSTEDYINGALGIEYLGYRIFRLGPKAVPIIISELESVKLYGQLSILCESICLHLEVASPGIEKALPPLYRKFCSEEIIGEHYVSSYYLKKALSLYGEKAIPYLLEAASCKSRGSARAGAVEILEELRREAGSEN